LIDQVAQGKTPEPGDNKQKPKGARDMEELDLEVSGEFEEMGNEEEEMENEEDEIAELEHKIAVLTVEKEGRSLYLEALRIVQERPDLDPRNEMEEWGISYPRKFLIGRLLDNLFWANGEEDLRVGVKDDLKPYVDWYSRASKFEKSEAWSIFETHSE
jgi:hypothetical protein